MTYPIKGTWEFIQAKPTKITCQTCGSVATVPHGTEAIIHKCPVANQAGRDD